MSAAPARTATRGRRSVLGSGLRAGRWLGVCQLMLALRLVPTAGLGLCAALCVLSGCGETRPRRPRNLLVVVLDTLRPDHLGCYGYEQDTSPNLDRLAGGGVVFEDVQSAAPWTAPSLISLMTALHPDVHGVRDHPRPARMPDTVTTLAELLREQGLSTAAITEGGFARGIFGLDQGFDLYRENPYEEEAPNAHMAISRLRENVEVALDWLDENHAEPFFLFFHTYEPHTPYHPEPEHLRAVLPEYDPAAEREALRDVVARWLDGTPLAEEDWLALARHAYHCKLREAGDLYEDERLQSRRAELWDRLLERGYGRADFELLPRVLPFLLALYDAEIRYADEQVGRILARLRELGHGEDTLVAVVSDHGEAFGEHGGMGHGPDLHEEVLRICLVMSGPGLEEAPARVPELVRSVDVMPTVLDLFGIPADDLPLQGRSLLPLLRGEEGVVPAFSHSTSAHNPANRWYGVRTPDWRYLARAQGPERLLYDLRSDPGETRDVHAEEPDVAERLEEILWRQRRTDERVRKRFEGELTWPELDAELQRELRGLGYIEDEEQR